MKSYPVPEILKAKARSVRGYHLESMSCFGNEKSKTVVFRFYMGYCDFPLKDFLLDNVKESKIIEIKNRVIVELKLE